MHFVLIHGACHGAWCWYKVSSLLKSADHKVSALDMAASGINPKKVEDLQSSSDYYEPLFEFMTNLNSQEKVILVAHSKCGMGLAIAMEKFPEKISVAVFVAAAMPGPNLNSMEIFLRYVKTWIHNQKNEDPQIIFGNGFWPPTAILLGPKQMALRLYRRSPPEDLELGKLLVRPDPLFIEAGDEMVYTKERYGSVPRVFILCDEEYDEDQKWMVGKNPPNEYKFINGSDHMVMLSKPQELSSYLLEIGQKYS